MPKSFVIADDHALTANGMATALETHGKCKVLATVSNGIEAIAQIKKHAPDCAVLDVDMPGASGLEVFLECQRWVPQTRIAMLTGTPNPTILHQLKEAGVNGIFTKSQDPDTICKGIYAVACGQQVFGQNVEQILAQTQQPEKLTPRELEVLIGLSKGLSNQGIADRLHVSPKTVDSHRTSLMRKMGVNSTAALLVKAMRGGFF